MNVGWKLTRECRAALLARHPPRYAKAVADHVTFEREGVNGYSSMPRDPAFYRAFEHAPVPAVDAVLPPFGATAWFSTLCIGPCTKPWPMNSKPASSAADATRG